MPAGVGVVSRSGPHDPHRFGQVDALLSIANDACNRISEAVNGLAANKTKDEVLTAIESIFVSKYCIRFERTLEGNGTGFFVGSTLTLADVALWRLLDFPSAMLTVWPDALEILRERFPLLLEHFDRLDAHPKIRQYMNSKYPAGKGCVPSATSSEGSPDGRWDCWGGAERSVKPEALAFWGPSQSTVGPS